jgi:hypothetical protein
MKLQWPSKNFGMGGGEHTEIYVTIFALQQSNVSRSLHIVSYYYNLTLILY